jgi:hypothetical protein
VVGDVVGDELGDVDGVEIDDAVGVVVVDVVRSDVVDDVVGDRVIVDPTERLDDGSDWQPRDRVLADSGCNFALYAQDSGVVLADDIDCDRVSATSVLADCDDVVRVPAVSACVCVCGGGGGSPRVPKTDSVCVYLIAALNWDFALIRTFSVHPV